MSDQRPRLLVILGSVRPVRRGPAVAGWFIDEATAHGAFEVVFEDLAERKLPFLDEENHPLQGDYAKDHTKAWAETVEAADALVLITPEYNYGYPPALKNAIDFLHREWRYLPLGFVSYGGVSAGTRAVQQLRQVVGYLRMYPIMEAVNIPFVRNMIGEDGELEPNDSMVRGATAMLDELAKVQTAMGPLRRPS